MEKFILGKKIEMSQMFDEKGNVIPVTLIEAGPCYITQIKAEKEDKYEAIQVGFEKLKKENKIKKPQKSKPYRYLREFRVSGQEAKEGLVPLEAGDKIDVSIFTEGEKVKISGISKGKGFAGGVKRWGFHGQSATHGTKHTERTIGSIGSMFPQRVLKGKKMPGRMGSDRVTVKNLKIAKIDIENNLLAVKGAVPGKRGTLLRISNF
jgi:large subunit ribosomal protein L3